MTPQQPTTQPAEPMTDLERLTIERDVWRRRCLFEQTFTEEMRTERNDALTRAEEAEKERDAWFMDIAFAAGDLAIPIPEPGTDSARLVCANVLLRRERDASQAQVAALRAALSALVNAIEDADESADEWLSWYHADDFANYLSQARAALNKPSPATNADERE